MMNTFYNWQENKDEIFQTISPCYFLQLCPEAIVNPISIILISKWDFTITTISPVPFPWSSQVGLNTLMTKEFDPICEVQENGNGFFSK